MIIQKIEDIINEIVSKIYDNDKIHVVRSNRPDLCDYQINEVFSLAKKNSKSPIEVGEEIVNEINKFENFNSYFSKVEFVRPGFINITLSDEALCSNLNYMFKNEKFGLKIPKQETYFLDYGGPNIAKPLHVGHMRTAIVGESVKRIIEYFNHKTISDVHFGDYGLQIGEVIYGLLENNVDVDAITIEMLDDIYPKMSARCKEDENLLAECQQITKDLQENNELYTKYWKKICEISIKDIKRIYEYLSVDFDLWLGESDCYKTIPIVEEILKEKELLESSNGAYVVYVNDDTDKNEIPPLLFKKTNGAYLYPSTDLATIYDRVKEYNPDHILYVVDNRQALHFKQVFRTSDKAGIISLDKLEHLGYGTVNGEDGKPYKTRSGQTPKLDNLFKEAKEILISKKETNEAMDPSDVDKIVNSILKFADLQNNRERDYIFDIAKFSDITGKTGPYVLYTYLRINKIIEDKEINENILNNKIYNNYERELKLKLLEYDKALEGALNNRMPSYIADYVYELCVLVNAFYQNNHINGLEDIEKKNNWIYLLTLTNKLIKELLNLLAIEIPSKM